MSIKLIKTVAMERNFPIEHHVEGSATHRVIKRENKRRSVIWHFFSDVGPNRAKCSTCNSVLSTTGGSTANLFRHIRKKHPDCYIEPQGGQVTTLIISPTEKQEESGQECEPSQHPQHVESPPPSPEEIPTAQSSSKPSWIYNTRGPEIVKDLILVLFANNAPAVVAESKLRLYDLGSIHHSKSQLAKLLIEMCKNSNLTALEFGAFAMKILQPYNDCECAGNFTVSQHECPLMRFLEFSKMIEVSNGNYIEFVSNYNWIDTSELEYFDFK